MTSSGRPGTPPGCSGARRPEKRVTARSKLPQKKCTGLALPRNPVRKRRKTRSDLHEHAPERVRRDRVVGAVHLVLRKGDRVGHLVRPHVDRGVDSRGGELRREPAIEGRDRHRLEAEAAVGRIGGADHEAMADQVEVDLDEALAGMDRRRAEAAGMDVERHVPAVVEPGRKRQPQLADDLGPEVQRRGAVAPGRVVERRPGEGVARCRDRAGRAHGRARRSDSTKLT